MTTDPIADYLTRIRNGLMARKKIVDIPASNLKKDITKILYEKGYILNYKFEKDKKQGIIKIALKYDPVNKIPAIKELKKISKPGLRKFVNKDNIPQVLNGLGIAIISTSRGVITDKEARKMNVGGELLCYIN